jgi:flavorubredoxin
MEAQRTMTSSVYTLPRELAPGIFWLGDCFSVTYGGRDLHQYNSVYLVCGDDASLLVDAGFPKDIATIVEQMESLFARGAPPLRYVFTTHTETPHASGVGRILERYPSVMSYGDTTDLHLAFPEYADRLHQLEPGDSLDLGGTEFRIVEAVVRDHAYTRWGFDTRRRVLFAADGFAYSHYHDAGHCGHLAEEAPTLDFSDMTALFADLALYWTRFVEMEPYIERLESLILDELEVNIIAPTHGLPITDPTATLPLIVDGLRAGSAGLTRGL